MNLTLQQLEAVFVQLTRTPEPPEKWSFREAKSLSDADGVMFLDPQQFVENGGNKGTSSVICWFQAKGIPTELKPGPGRWEVGGSSIDDLSLFPSVDLGAGRWHGHVTNGRVT